MAKILVIESDVDFEVDTTKYNRDCYTRQFNGVHITLDNGKDIYFGIGNEQQCCEYWNYLEPKDDMKDFIGAEVLEIKEVKVNTLSTAMHSQLMESTDNLDLDAGDYQAVQVITSKGILEFVVYNAHTGFYAHDTILIFDDTATVRCL